MTTTRRAPAHAAVATRRHSGSQTALAWHVAGMVSWGPLLAGCLTGIGVTIALRIFAGPIETPVDLGAGVRASFAPVVAGLAFLLHDPHRQLTGALPARAWLTPAIRVALALPVLALSGIIQLRVAAHALAVDLHAAGQPAAGLPWVALTGELTAWCALALALAAGLERTRWRELTGVGAAIGTLASAGALALLPLHILPAAIIFMNSAERHYWMAAAELWVATGVTAALVAGWAAGDPWRRVRLLLCRVALRASGA
ncbi:MAG TPA: hypothetical protein VMA72_21680 [Streptosporangiaceae bacterium]|nr:hypothetical protein [Streptosporangiaceae bacterium]